MPLRYICGCIRVVFALKFPLAGLSYHFGRGVSFIKDSWRKTETREDPKHFVNVQEKSSEGLTLT